MKGATLNLHKLRFKKFKFREREIYSQLQVILCKRVLVPDEGGDMGDADLVRHALRSVHHLLFVHVPL